jgi:hypothetical protein
MAAVIELLAARFPEKSLYPLRLLSKEIRGIVDNILLAKYVPDERLDLAAENDHLKSVIVKMYGNGKDIFGACMMSMWKKNPFYVRMFVERKLIRPDDVIYEAMRMRMSELISYLLPRIPKDVQLYPYTAIMYDCVDFLTECINRGYNDWNYGLIHAAVEGKPHIAWEFIKRGANWFEVAIHNAKVYKNDIMIPFLIAAQCAHESKK